MVSWLIWDKTGVEQQDHNPNQKLRHSRFIFIVRSIDHGAHKGKSSLVIAKLAIIIASIYHGTHLKGSIQGE